METEIQPPAKQRKTGLVHVLSGDGNGKTTSAIGIAVRASGRGMKAAFVQFLKNGLSSELEPMQRLGVEVVGGARYSEKDLRAGLPQETVFMAYNSSFKADESDRKVAKEAFAKATGYARSGKYDLVVLDGIFGAVRAGL
ncbi:MAG TPA: cob(I)yrinic acid a,c-diamide adenosyltransferase, partial [Candidatus Micrarchaeota archaeon]|nr:cob(I)yrinic acid a,c-diamide adenosyltransferase [Candidatus Micrarchaeota archaeon]